MRLDFEHSCCGARNGRDPHKSPESCANAQPVGSWCGSTTARCSAPRRGVTGHLEPKIDRFAIGLPELGCTHPSALAVARPA